MVKTLSQLYMEARRALSAQDEPDIAGLYARNLLCFVTGKTPEQLLADMQMYASEAVCKQMEDAVARVVAGEPVAYVIGQWDFYGMTLYVDKNVLIPRDDTCAVTDLAIHRALFLEQSPRILDLCTGSGCIGLAIAHRVKDAKITLADISQAALTVARKNISLQKLTGRVSCVQADALSKPKPFLGKFDLIVSNPPYITSEEMKQLPISVKNYEPSLALEGGNDGLDFYRAIACNYKDALKPGGYLCFEFGMGQADAVCEILQMNGYTILERSRDYNDRERAVLAQLGRKEDENGNEKDSI
ncbi:MAG: peptide chain release factor N(5)-glutamine methyltransferase [Oscillospiraceae bacterium]|nr:peptide chain release factor N(5)-glutamine methyltransferase [Oscillospiraceae bacterium]